MKEDLKSYRKHFSDSSFWKKLRGYAKQAGVKIIYTALLLYYAYQRKETPTWAKSIIIGILGYFLAPIDLIPDITPIVGYTDDLGIMGVGLVTIASYINNDIKEKARTQLRDWFGDYDETELQDIDDQL